MMRKTRLAGSSADSSRSVSTTALFRRTAVFVLPAFCLWHAAATFKLSHVVGQVSLVAAVLAIVLGLWLRWFVRHTTTLLAVMILTTVFSMLYLQGIVMPVVYLYHIHRSDLAYIVAPGLALAFVALALWRLRVAFRTGWSGPAEEGPRVRLVQNTLDRVATPEMSRFTAFVVALLACWAIAVALVRGQPSYFPAVIVVGPILLAAVFTEAVAHVGAFYCVFRRLEKQRRVRFELPTLR